MQKDGEGQPMYENTADFLEKKLISDILNRKMRMKTSRNPIRIMGKAVQVDNVIDLMTDWSSSTIMWLRPMQGGGNGLHARSLTYREALKGSIASSFLNIDGDAIDFKIADNVFADKVYFSEFLPNVWTNRKFMLSTRNKSMSKSSMYVFHAKPEEYVSLTTMVAQMHYLKHPKTGKSLWDCYDIVFNKETGVHELKWVAPPRGYQKIGTGKKDRYR